MINESSFFLPNFLNLLVILTNHTKIHTDLNSNTLNLCRFFVLRAIYTKSAIVTQPITQFNWLCIYPHARIIFLQIFPIKCSSILFPFKCFQNIGISRNTFAYSEWSFPRWRPFAEFRTLCSYRQNQLSNHFSLVKGLGFYLFYRTIGQPWLCLPQHLQGLSTDDQPSLPIHLSLKLNTHRQLTDPEA